MNGKDVALAGLGLLTIATLSISEFNRQQFEGQMAQLEVMFAQGQEDIQDVKAFCVAEDMQFVKLLNETREVVGLEVINYATAKER